MKKFADDQCSSITKGSVYDINYVHTIFYQGTELIRNLMFNGSMHVLCFTFADTVFLLGTAELVTLF